MIIEYNASAFTPAGWRSITVTAEAERLSPGMAQVTRVVAIGGREPAYAMSRTGAKRQEYNGLGIARREVGAKKRLSSCTIVEGGAA